MIAKLSKISTAFVTSLAVTFLCLGSPTPAQAEDYCAPLPPPAQIDSVYHDDYIRTDLTQVVEGRVDYTLSSGDQASFSILIASNGTGVAHFEINNQIVIYATFEESVPGTGFQVGPMVETWVSPNLALLPEEIIAELAQESVTELLLNGLVPEPLKCSAFGKKVLKWAKHLTYGVLGAATAGCCAAASVIGCILCGGAAGAAGSAAGDALDEHCD